MDMLDESIDDLKRCLKTLNKISESCCVPQRSSNMNEALDVIENTVANLIQFRDADGNISHCINNIGVVGSKVGFLYASCCTNEREPLYQALFKGLIDVNRSLLSITGQRH